jgi:hypothetical protein
MICAPMPGPRNIISVELVASADKVLKQTVERTKLAKKDVIARMCEWFAEQDVEVQKIVLGEIPASLAEAAKELALQKLRGATVEPLPARELRVGVPFTQAAEAPHPAPAKKRPDPARRK